MDQNDKTLPLRGADPSPRSILPSVCVCVYMCARARACALCHSTWSRSD